MKVKSKTLILTLFLSLGLLLSIYATSAETITKTLYSWVKDAAGNISLPLSDTVDITLPDEPTNTYYVSYSEGLDTNNGTSSSTPWKTIAKVNSQTFTPGASILFKKGDTWTGETITVNSSGNSTSPITYSSYGTGAQPIISGFTTITGWTSEGGGIYSKVIASQSQTNMVTIDGVQYGMGRWPNAGEYLTYESAVGNTSITDNELTSLSSNNWTGAEAVITRNGWLIDRVPITNHTGNTITAPSSVSPSENYIKDNNYFIQNDLRTLDQYGEWYHNFSTGKFYMYFGGVNPTSKIVQVATLNNLIYIYPNYITVDNLSFIGSIKENIKTSTSDYSIIENNTINFSGTDAINMSGSGDIIRNNSINDVNKVAIYSAAATGVPGNITISDNTITNVAIIEGQGNLPYFYNAAIFLYNDIFSISGNSIINTGFDGIALSSAPKTGIIKNNFFDNTCTLRGDQGSIYISGNKTAITVDGNIVLNSKGQGIYIDQASTNVTVSNNTVANDTDGTGIKIHMANHNIITNNTLYNNYFGIDLENWENLDNLGFNTITNNISVAKTSAQYPLSLIQRYTGYLSNLASSTYNNNYYARPINDNTNVYTNLPVVGHVDKTLSGWQTLSNQDANSHTSPVTITDPNDILFEYNATTSNKTVSLGSNTYVDITGATKTGSVTLLPYTSIILIKTN